MPQKHPYFPAEKIALVSRGELIGDALMLIPYLRAVRSVWPKAEIHWVSSPGRTPLNTTLKDLTASLIDVFHIQPLWLKDKKAQAPSFDLVIDTRNRWKLALRARSMLPHKLFIATAFRYLFSDRRPSLLKPRPTHLHDKLFQTIELAAGYLPKLQFGLEIQPDLKEKARHLLPEGPVYIGIAPGAGGAIKKWPLERFEAVAQKQVRLNRVPVFLLGPQESDLYNRLSLAVPKALFPLQAHDIWGRHDVLLEHTLAVASCLTLAVANDSGLSHMLSSTNCPLVSLFGPTSAEKIAPRVTFRKILKARDFGSRKMDAIPTEAVLKAIDALVLELSR